MSDLILSLVSDPAAPAIDDGARALVAARVQALSIGMAAPETLSPGVAEEYRLIGVADKDRLLTALRGAVAGRRIDVNLVPAEGRRKKLLIADMDSTIIGQECIDELADFAGLKAEIAAVTEKAMRGEIGFEESLKARVAQLKGLPEDTLARVYEERVRLTPGAGTGSGNGSGYRR